ncbi:MAG: hypothetical protein AAFX99_23545, partial [Myxococcota bacterium]
FGGYASPLKRVMDRIINLCSPFYTTVAGETHHKPRYDTYPLILGVGLLPEPNPEEEALFTTLVGRNALNFFAPSWDAGVLIASDPPERKRALLDTWVGNLVQRGGRPSEPAPQPTVYRPDELGECLATPETTRALLLVGSAKPTGTSTSEALATHFGGQLEQHGVTLELRHVHKAISPRGLAGLLEAVDRADVIVLFSPLYVDSLPYPVTLALERIEAHRAAQHAPRPGRWLAILNSGFPEMQHNFTALAICRNFCHRAGYTWLGGIPLGGGAAIGGKPLAQRGGPFQRVACALDQSALAIAHHTPLPPEVTALADKPLLSPSLYRPISSVMWCVEALRQHTLLHLRDTPLEEKASIR